MSSRPRSTALSAKIISRSPLSPSESSPVKNIAASKFLCGVCEDVLKKPLLTRCCVGRVCTQCLEDWEAVECSTDDKSLRLCPLCQSSRFTCIADEATERQLEETTISCRNKELGCSWEGSMARIADHLQSMDGCPFVVIACPENCGKSFRRSSLTDHLMSECFLCWHKCEHCNGHFVEGSAEQHYEANCPSFPVPCPNNCGAIVKKFEVSSHEDECLLVEVPCPYVSVGCSVVMLRKDSSEHQRSYQAEHQLMAFQHLLKDITTLKAQLSESQKEQAVMKERFEKCQSELAQARCVIKQQLLSTNQTSAVLHRELNYFSASDTCEALALECIKTHIGHVVDPSLHSLKKNKPPLTFRLSGYSELKSTDTTWYSPPFYIKDSYKMCIAVHLNGDQEGVGSHISVHIHLMAGEFDSELKWPLVYKEQIQISLMRQQLKHSYSTLPMKNRIASAITSHRSLSQSQDSSNFNGVQADPLSVVATQTIQSLVFKLNPILKPTGTIGLSFGHIALFCLQSKVDSTVLMNDSIVWQLTSK